MAGCSSQPELRVYELHGATMGTEYIVKASMGHVRDLPKKDIGVDTEKRFEPTYEPLVGRKKILTELKRYAKAAPKVFLATDLDREGASRQQSRRPELARQSATVSP